MNDWAPPVSNSLGVPGTLLFENERVRVWELIMKPGEVCQWHIHPYDHLLVVNGGAQIEGLTATGESVHLNIADNQTFFIPKSDVPEIARNVSKDRTLRELIIDFKDASAAREAFSSFNFYSPGTATTASPQGGQS